MDPLLDPALPGLVSLAMERRDQGIDPDLDEICAERPDLRDAVAATLAESERIPTLQRTVATRDPLRGRIFHGRYRLTERLGAGAMGVVYEALDLELNRPVAVKVLRSLVLADEEAEVRFEREGSALAALHHDSIVTVFDRGRAEEGEQFLVMELLDGLSLGSLLDCETSKKTDTKWVAHELGIPELEERSWLRLAVRWIAELAEALQSAHEAGILHRDIKPSNVFIRLDGRAMLLDFGIASAPDQETITREGSAVGTPAYMAPESLSAGSEPQATLDVYGLSATLYHLVTRRPPYEGTPSQIISRLITKDPPRASKVRAGLHRDLQAILDRGMARSPRDRYSSAKELAADLRAFLDHLPVKARPVSRVTRQWRYLRRKPSVTLSGFILLCLPLAWWTLDHQKHLNEERQRAYNQALRHLPASRDTTLPELRQLINEDSYSRASAALNHAVSLEKGAFYARLRRASFALDHGELEAARADMQKIAEQVNTPFARKLSERYLDLPDSSRSALDLQLEDLPEPRSLDERYLLGYHWARTGKRSEAANYLGDEDFANYLPAAEIRALRLQSKPDAMMLELSGFAAKLGGHTPTSGGFMTACLVARKRYGEAYELATNLLELSPDSPPLLQNGARAAWRLGNSEDASRLYAQSIRLQPSYSRVWGYYIQTLLNLTDLDHAEAEIARAEPYNSPRDQALWKAQLATHRATQHLYRGALDDFAADAKRANAFYDRLLEISPNHTGYTMEYARGLLSQEPGDFFAAICQYMSKVSPKRRYLELFLEHLPEEPTPEDAQLIYKALQPYVVVMRETASPTKAPFASPLTPTR